MTTANTTTANQTLVESATSQDFRMLINGDLVDAKDGRTYDTSSPSSEEQLATIPAAGAADVEVAVDAAAAAFEAWSALRTRERVGFLRRALDVLADNGEELAALDSADGGNPITAMRGDIQLSIDVLEPALGWADGVHGETFPGAPDHLHYSVREPYGVVARIIPFNHPLFFATRSFVPLLMGNTVVLKTPDQTPLSGLRLAELLADVFPPGVFNVLSGVGAVTGDALVRHPAVRRVAFTGSVPTGLAIQRAVAESAIKHLSLELGGKNPMIVFPDADVAAVAEGAVRGMNFRWTSGQSCGSTSRVLMHESLLDEFLEALGDEVSRVVIGDPLDDVTEMGSQVSQAHYDKVIGYIESAKAEGANVVAGGGRPDHLDKGFFVAPTVLRDVEPTFKVANEEIFGPVMSVMTWSNEEEMLKVANGVEYGLTASLWSRDIGHAQRVARRVQAGYVWINTCSAHFPGVPFGGFKDSGLGREESAAELLSYTQEKAMNVFLGNV